MKKFQRREFLKTASIAAAAAGTGTLVSCKTEKNNGGHHPGNGQKCALERMKSGGIAHGRSKNYFEHTKQVDGDIGDRGGGHALTKLGDDRVGIVTINAN